MSLTRDEVQHIAELAKLQLTEAEEALYQEQLSDILELYAAPEHPRYRGHSADGDGAAAAQCHA